MNEFLQIGILPVVLTLGAFQIGQLCQRKLKSPLANPLVIAVVLVLLFMALTGMSSEDYQAGTASFSWLITPATICLAIPMYEQLQVLRRNLWAVLAGIAAGALSCLTVVILFAILFSFDRTLLITLLPKSVTTAIGVALSELGGGIPSITSAVIILTGILASILSKPCFRLFRLTDPIAQGVALGTSGHVIATSKANELGSLTGAASSLSLVVAGLLTAAVFPLLLHML